MLLPILLVATGLASCLLLADHLLHGTTTESKETKPSGGVASDNKRPPQAKKRKKKVIKDKAEKVELKETAVVSTETEIKQESLKPPEANPDQQTA